MNALKHISKTGELTITPSHDVSLFLQNRNLLLSLSLLFLSLSCLVSFSFCFLMGKIGRIAQKAHFASCHSLLSVYLSWRNSLKPTDHQLQLSNVQHALTKGTFSTKFTELNTASQSGKNLKSLHALSGLISALSAFHPVFFCRVLLCLLSIWKLKRDSFLLSLPGTLWPAVAALSHWALHRITDSITKLWGWWMSPDYLGHSLSWLPSIVFCWTLTYSKDRDSIASLGNLWQCSVWQSSTIVSFYFAGISRVSIFAHRTLFFQWDTLGRRASWWEKVHPAEPYLNSLSSLGTPSK